MTHPSQTTYQEIAPLEDRERRREQMQGDRAAGMTLSQIGEKYGLSRERVRQVLERPPQDLGLPRRLQLERRREVLVEKRELWGRRSSPAGVARVLAIDAELREVDAELAEVGSPQEVLVEQSGSTP